MIENLSIVISSCLNKPNRKIYLMETIKSLRDNFGDVEILIGFDKYGKDIDGVKCYIHEKGLGHSWNWGIDNASNEYILQIEDDWKFTIKDNDIGFSHEEFNKKIEIIKEYDGIYRFGNLLENPSWINGVLKFKTEYDIFYELKRTDKYMCNDFLMYYYSNQPHMKKRDLHCRIGYYSESVPPHVVETNMCKNYYHSNKRVFCSSSEDFDFIHLGEISARK